ncbi:unnamed protein product [Ambrosiozyma monospora]|uniref:Unnamed protein product n=1 Tax=Ambrosiozyma monospora TaxID=43982 RepID=A0A9W7DDC0_AMBMO|nr:unnamed protein product [Ambrosiozyma monospora]
MTNTDIARTTAIDIASQLPREIQNLILQTVVLRYYDFYNSDYLSSDHNLKGYFRKRYHDRDVLVPLISLINYSDPLLDDAVRLALPKLSFENSELMRSRFVQQFANFALSKSTTRMFKFSTNTQRPFPLAEKLMESTFEQTISEFYHFFGETLDFRAPAFELCSTLMLSVPNIKHVCRSGLLSRSNHLKILKLSIGTGEEYLLNKFTKEIRNWFNVNPRNKTDKSLILDLQFFWINSNWSGL